MGQGEILCNGWDQSSYPLLMLFVSIWDSFLAQASVLQLFQHAAKLSREGAHLSLQSESF